MTNLCRKVQRVCSQVRGRDLVVALQPGAEPMIEIREKGCRNGYAIPVSGLFTILALREADLMASRRGRRKKK